MMIDRYQIALSHIPPPGYGAGAHQSFLGVANYGVMAGVTPEQIAEDIRRHVPPGGRQVGDKEITDAVRKAIADHSGGTYTPKPRPKPVVSDGKLALQKIIDQAKITTEVDLWEASPVRLLNDPKQDPALLLRTLYESTDKLFIDDRYGERTIQTADAWGTHFKNGGKTAPHIIINPLTGLMGLTKSGEPSYRADSCIKDFRYCLIEFDTLGREEQIKFWSAVKLPIVCLIDSGGKSIHSWIDVQRLARVETPEQWQTEIKSRLYDQILKPLGVDSACCNASRLSRLPGHLRQEKKSMQKILWLSPEGRPVC
jgi:hypothetical protein